MANKELRPNGNMVLKIDWRNEKVIIYIPLVVFVVLVGFWWQFSQKPPDNLISTTFICDSQGKPVFDIFLISDGNFAFPDQLGNASFLRNSLAEFVSVRDAITKKELLRIKLDQSKTLPPRIVIPK